MAEASQGDAEAGEHLSEEPPEEVARLITAGRKIEAIKLTARLSGMSLIEAKACVDQWMNARRSERDSGFGNPWTSGRPIPLLLMLVALILMAGATLLFELFMDSLDPAPTDKPDTNRHELVLPRRVGE